ncbi:hypothetical protein JD844_002083 [Phrynosoma platyrhinos]|uniref:IF rod domain-containing protein n=1 Tax=Phrynosoma platyrhinos TaxID=52577 RepID=A0ABQ7TAV6_PHRPL|nr:hypothetical protein JD844_002083 [Phrynosoma platyrhinos]
MAAAFSSRSQSFSGSVHGPRGGSVLGLAKPRSVSNIYGIMTALPPSVKDALAGRYGAAETNILDINQKGTMQNLNDRLAAYLERVRSLEEANAQLEKNIREIYVKRASAGGPDLSGYFNTLSELKSKIEQATLNNAGLLLQIDNAKLAADDFKVNDLTGLRKVLEEVNASRASLQVQVDNLQEELAYLKRNHGECDALNREVAVSTEALQAAQMKIIELKRLAQALEIELQSLRSMKIALEGTLMETESRYGMELSRLCDLISAREAELLHLRSDVQNQAEDYKRLMDIKNRLEQEIATYRRLLEG